MNRRRATACATIAALVAIMAPASAAHAQEGEIIIPEWLEQLPDWVRQLFAWYFTGQISESEFKTAMIYLIDNGIIQVDAQADSAIRAPPAADRAAPPAADRAELPADIAHYLNAYRDAYNAHEAAEDTIDLDWSWGIPSGEGYNADSLLSYASRAAHDIQWSIRKDTVITRSDAWHRADSEIFRAAHDAENDKAFYGMYSTNHTARNAVNAAEAARDRVEAAIERHRISDLAQAEHDEISNVLNLAVTFSHTTIDYLNALAAIEHSKAGAWRVAEHAAFKHADALDDAGADEWAGDAYRIAAASAGDAADSYTAAAAELDAAADAWAAAADAWAAAADAWAAAEDGWATIQAARQGAAE